MENKTKVMVGLLVVMVVAGGFLLLPAVSADESPVRTGDGRGGRHVFRRRAVIWPWFIKNSIPETLIGEAAAFERFILVLEIEGEPINVVIPRFWSVGEEVLNTDELLDGDPFELGDEMTLETLMRELVNDTHTVRSYFAYSIEIDGVTATALLPFNVETT